MDQVMTVERANSTDGGDQVSVHLGQAPPSLPCPKCGRLRTPGNGLCRECNRLRMQARRSAQETDRKPCVHCGGRLPHAAGRCPELYRRYLICRGRNKTNDQWPGYGDVLSEDVLITVGSHWPRPTRYPPPSDVFPGLDPGLDHRLIRDTRDKDVALCQGIAAVPVANQQEFYELYLVDPADARHWATLPRWKRLIRKGDQDDIQIWKFFTIQRLFMERAARETVPAWPMASQGAQLSQTFGTLFYLTPEGLQKLVDVMSTYGDMLQYGRDLGDVTKKPWEEKPPPTR